MPSVTDLQQQQQTSSSNTHGKSTPPPSSSSSTQQLTSTDPNNSDPLTQAILLFEKKQRNLGKRKEKLESYKQLAATGAELNKDQKEALAKYPEVLGQIECAKDLGEQFKKIQTETAKYQKRLLKLAADEKRQSVSQRLREYAQIRYLLDHRPTSLKTEESTLLDELSAVIVPTDNTSNSISRSVDTVLSIYQSGPSSTTIKNLPGKNVQEVREILEQLVRNVEPQKVSSVVIPPEQEQTQTQIQTPAPAPAPIQETIETNNIQSTNNDNNNNSININNNTSLNEYPLQFDTRNPNISLEQIIQDNTFLSNDLHDQSQDNNDNQLSNSEQYLQTFTIVNSNQQPSSSSIENQQQDNSNEQHQQQSDEQWQHQRGNGNVQRNEHGQNEGGHKPYRGRPNHYNQSWRGSNGGRYDNSYGNNQRPYYENNRGRGGSNSNYRGNRGGGGGGNHRFGNTRGYNNNNGNGYQNSAQYQQNNNNQHQQQTRSAPPPSTQQQ
ncbi:unnamed protein product [Adineta steineri]|uniref:Uncharacterized protein n=1 Tax=Adineta steineri TaxID=433720 RepID=A0A813VNC9_9BILA|nr:unnamed protein product [Adineta steineri]CAF0920575.1 unnamed protein product [Adineta steineri]